MIAWPTDRIAIPVPDYNAGPRNATISSAPGYPVTFHRSRFQKSYVVLRVGWFLDESQNNALKSFFFYTVYNGTAPFSLELRYPQNSALATWMVRFLEGLEMEHIDGGWKVTGTLELIRTL
jgi:hypothetical protein